MEIALWIVDLLIPAAFVVLGIYFTIVPVKGRCKTKGYRTKRSLKNEDTWCYAQRIFPIVWLVLGICLIGGIVLCNFVVPVTHEVRSVFFVVISIGAMLLSMPIIEGLIKRKFRGIVD